LAFGEQSPTEGETGISWQTWSDGVGGTPTIAGDVDWGKVQLSGGDKGQSAVYDFGSVANRLHTLSEDRYGAGQGSTTLYIRGQATSFNQDDVGPAWEEYASAVSKTWQWMQIKAEK